MRCVLRETMPERRYLLSDSDARGRHMMRAALAILIVTLSPSSIVGQKQHQPSSQKSNVTKDTSKPSESVPALNNPSPPEKQQETKEQANGRPSFWDIYWPTLALVLVTGVAVIYAIKTMRAIREQVQEMRSAGKQTDKLVSESIAQTKTLVQQAESLAQSAYHLGESAAGAHRSARAMEEVATHIANSVEAARDSVAALRERTAQQMRAYLTVIVGTAVYQEEAKNTRFLGLPLLLNTGHTPAHKVSYVAAADVLPVPLPDDFTFPLTDAFKGASVVGAQQNNQLFAPVEHFVDESEVPDIKIAKGKALYAWGIVRYEDIFGESHVTKFCQLITWLPNGNVFGIFIPKHNEAT